MTRANHRNINTLYILSQDLCERREKYVQRKHQKALAKVQTMVSYKGRLESQGKHLVGCTSPHVLLAVSIIMAAASLSSRKRTTAGS